MRVWLLAALVAACGGGHDDFMLPPEPRMVEADKPAKPVDVAPLVPKTPGVFGPWAKLAIGTDREAAEKAEPALFHGTIAKSGYEVGVDGKRIAADATPRFGGMFANGHLAGYTIIVDAKGTAAIEAVWGKPTTVTDARAKLHAVWTAGDLRVETTTTTGITQLTVTTFVPLARYLGKKGFAFEAKRSLIGMSAADAVAQIKAWTDAEHLAMSVEGELGSLAKAIGDATGRRVSPSQIVVVGADGQAKAIAPRSIDVMLPPTEGSFESTEYNFTRLRLWLDVKGTVNHFWFDIWIANDAAYKSATALLAKTYGAPKLGATLHYPTMPFVCFPGAPRAYASIEVGACR